MKFGRAAALVFLVSLLFNAGCGRSSRKQLLASDASQLKLRSIQTRVYDTTDREKMLRTIMATLQDLNFVIDNANLDLGTVSATKLDSYALRMTVSVRPRGETQLLVRANAQCNLQAIEEPKPYQQFFDSLSKAMFLAAQQVD